MSASQTHRALAQAHRLLMATLMAAPVLIVVVVAFVLPAGEPDIVLLGVVVVLGAAVAAAVPALGYRMQPLEPGLAAEDAHRQALGRYQSSAILRFALTETPVILGLVLGFLDESLLHPVVGAVISVVLMGLHVWPSRRVVERSAETLEARGVDSGLRATFGH